MKHYSGRLRPVTLALFVSVAALSAPPAAFANTPGTTAPVTQPAPAPAPVVLPAVPTPPSQRPVRIGLGRGVLTAEVKAAGGLYVVAEGAIHWETPPGETVRVNLLNGKFQVVGLAKAFTGPVRLVPRPAQAANYVTYKGLPYRGEMELIVNPKDQKLAVVNVLNLEDYVLGVINKEMPASWPLEALKAQAVAARNFILANMGKRADEGFNLLDTTADQAYGGVNSEHPNGHRAVEATRGQVLTYNGHIIKNYYFASSGGHTEHNENIWLGGTPLTYLRGVPDFDDLKANLRYAWRYTYTPEELARALKSAGHNIGTVVRVRPDAQKGVSGRPLRWYIDGTAGTVTLSGEGFRFLLSPALPSSPKSAVYSAGGLVNTTRTYQSSDTFSVLGGDRTVKQVSGKNIQVVSASRTPQPAGTTVAAVGPRAQQAGVLEVTGGGWGHSIGMSQWGAHGLALLGRSYDQILSHYYQGAKVETR